MVILTNTILYNRMIVIGSYHEFFTPTEQSYLLQDIINLDILTTCESCALVNDFRMINGNHFANNFTYQNNCYSLFICTSDH